MKNQYVGDVSDYCKYGVLRILSKDTSLGVCWMLTEDDGGGDGLKRQYLERPNLWRRRDPELFDILRLLPRRHVAEIEKSQILPNAKFHQDLLHDNLSRRKQFLAAMPQKLDGCELVFFDPDNGLEVSSVPKGRTSSRKYLYFDELSETFDGGASVIIYQHRQRRPLDKQARDVVERIRSLLDADPLLMVSPHVLFVIVPQRERRKELLRKVRLIEAAWGPTIRQLRVERTSVARSHHSSG